MELSRLGRKEPAKRIVDINMLVKEVPQDLKGDHGKAVFEMKDLPSAKADIELLKQVFMNLISYAIKYSRKKV